MAVTDPLLRQLVEAFIVEDLTGFIARTRDIRYGVDPEEDPTFESDPDARVFARAVKEAWAAEADHAFMDSVTKIHWMKAATDYNIMKLLEASGRDEISTMGYIRGPYNSGPGDWPVWGKIGFSIKGKTTIAANSMDDLFTGYHKNIPSNVREKYKASGTRKRPMGFNEFKAENYILDEKSFKPEMQGENEFIVGNWSVEAVVLTTSESAELSAALSGKKVPDWQVAEWDRIFGLLDRLGVKYLMRKHGRMARDWLNRNIK